ncbi:LysR family transcriptional regulator [Aquisalinus flavus]|uniref:LysR family transcriptional regulator n=1 Tax=Aquisalinus flavus TaxID=1526572 RepID=A0A8J2V4C6_9PROT|nr:LysR family transcriptional regulator [Aquisalinus flavus]MBD0426625.1 LysR family transcriptional regulator [Aquisalinus flavus]UNE47831.1 LysR family transcriptional regulator [Aquisalinus flavus]GGD06379.1 LysR family transcriptional regulator [Aquisalinus flavus]
MNDRSLESLDLNLLMALHWLLTERSVTDAARRLSLSQPATSRALARLRELFGDPLLVKSGRAMLPTPKAERLQPAVARMIESLRDVMRANEEFDPATQKGRVRIASFDYIGVIISHAWIQAIKPRAPALELDIVDLSYASARELVSGQIDLVIMPDMRLARNRPRVDFDQFVQKPIFSDRFMSCVRKSHPLSERKVTLEGYLRYEHALINPEGKEKGVVDEVLAENGDTRHIAYRTAGFLIALATVMNTDAILTAPSALFSVLPDKFYCFEPPVPLPPIAMNGAWHPNWTHDPRHKWLRDGLFGELAKRNR